MSKKRGLSCSFVFAVVMLFISTHSYADVGPYSGEFMACRAHNQGDCPSNLNGNGYDSSGPWCRHSPQEFYSGAFQLKPEFAGTTCSRPANGSEPGFVARVYCGINPDAGKCGRSRNSITDSLWCESPRILKYEVGVTARPVCILQDCPEPSVRDENGICRMPEPEPRQPGADMLKQGGCS